MSWDIEDTCYIRMPKQKASGPVYSDNIIFATGTTGYRIDEIMTGSGAGEIGEAGETGKAGESGKVGEAVLNSKDASACVCDYNDAYQRFVGNTYEVAKAMKSGGIGIVSARHKKHRRHNGDGAMNIDYIYTRYSDFGHSDRNSVKRRDR